MQVSIFSSVHSLYISTVNRYLHYLIIASFCDTVNPLNIPILYSGASIVTGIASLCANAEVDQCCPVSHP